MNNIKHFLCIALFAIGYNTYSMEQSSNKNTPQKNWGYTDYQEAKNNLLKRHAEEIEQFNYAVLFQAQELEDAIERKNFLDEAYSANTLEQIKKSQNRELNNLKKQFPAW